MSSLQSGKESEFKSPELGHGLSVQEAFRFGFDVTFKNLRQVVLSVLVGVVFSFILLLAVMLIFGGIFYILKELKVEPDYVTWIPGVLWLTCILGLVTGLINICQKIVDGKSVSWRSIFDGIRSSHKALASSLLFFCMVYLGLMLFLIPGLYWASQFFLFLIPIAVSGKGPITALKNSSAITKGKRWISFRFLLMTLVMNAFGALMLIIGLFVTIPATIFAMIYFYKNLSAEQ